MLQTNTVSRKTLELLKAICFNSQFDDFFLVGETALALQIGHRISIDLDFFCREEFDEENLKRILIEEFNAKISSIGNNSISGTINGVKFDFICHQYELINPIISADSVRLSSIEDIAAMKINAVRNRGSKKDFIDIYFLLQNLNLKKLLSLTDMKYPNHLDILTLKSLIYFEDADIQPDCEMLIDVNWKTVKKTIEKEVLKLL